LTNWTEMSRVEFDQTAVQGRKAREFVASAPQTLFPRLMPEAAPATALQPEAADPLGTASLLDLLDGP
jgi:hypothetical protein